MSGGWRAGAARARSSENTIEGAQPLVGLTGALSLTQETSTPLSEAASHRWGLKLASPVHSCLKACRVVRWAFIRAREVSGGQP